VILVGLRLVATVVGLSLIRSIDVGLKKIM